MRLNGRLWARSHRSLASFGWKRLNQQSTKVIAQNYSAHVHNVSLQSSSPVISTPMQRPPIVEMLLNVYRNIKTVYIQLLS